MGNRECGRLKGNPCGPLRPNTINVTMPTPSRNAPASWRLSPRRSSSVNSLRHPGQAAYRCDVFEPGSCCPCFQLLDADGVSVVTFGVGLGMDSSQALWIALHARANFLNLKIKTQLESAPPRTPWVGVLLEPALLAGSPAMKWLEDFVRCLSWSVLDRALSRADHGAGWVN